MSCASASCAWYAARSAVPAPVATTVATPQRRAFSIAISIACGPIRQPQAPVRIHHRGGRVVVDHPHLRGRVDRPAAQAGDVVRHHVADAVRVDPAVVGVHQAIHRPAHVLLGHAELAKMSPTVRRITADSTRTAMSSSTRNCFSIDGPLGRARLAAASGRRLRPGRRRLEQGQWIDRRGRAAFQPQRRDHESEAVAIQLPAGRREPIERHVVDDVHAHVGDDHLVDGLHGTLDPAGQHVGDAVAADHRDVALPQPGQRVGVEPGESQFAVAPLTLGRAARVAAGADQQDVARLDAHPLALLGCRQVFGVDRRARPRATRRP